MKHTLVIASRELAEKRFVFLAAAAFALIAAIVPLLPSIRGNRAEAVVIGAMILATGFALGLAAILGATIVGRDIAAGRMSFYFARPVGGAAIWFGKLAAAVVLVVGSFFIAVAPALVAGPMTVRRVWSGNIWQVTAVIGIAAIVLFFGAHALGTMIRSRSAILAIDFVAAVLVLSLTSMIVRPLALAQAVQATAFLGRLLCGALLVAAIGAGAWQLADGRSDRRRSHRAFSTFFWSAIAVTVVLAALFVAWILSAGPADLTGRMNVLQPRQGDAAILTGAARHRLDYRPMFLDSTRINGTVWAAFSRDGRRATLMELTSTLSPSAQLVVRDAANGWRATPTKLVFRRWVNRVAATDDLARIAVVDGEVATVYDVASSRSLGSFRIGTTFVRSMFFVTPDLVRLYAAAGPTVRVWEYDVAARALHTVGDATLSAQPILLRVSPDGTRALVGERGGRTMLRDARTLQPIAPADAKARFLQDGRLVTVPGRVVGEVAPGKVLIATATSTQLVDIDSGKVVARADGLQPVSTFGSFWSPDPRPALLNPNGYYTKKDGSLVRWNPLQPAS